MSGELHIHAVRGRGDLRRFVDLPSRIYRDDLHWVPALRSSQFKLFEKRVAFFEHAQMEMFLAVRGGAAVGRVAAIQNFAHNKQYGDTVGFFGFFECAPGDVEAARGLFAAAEKWLAGRGLTALRGPVNPSMNGECGLLVEGFDRPPMALMPYNMAEYPAMLESVGFGKAKDLYAYLLNVADYVPGTVSGDRLVRIEALLARRHPEVKVRALDMGRYLEDVGKLMGVFEAARSRNWGYVPVTPAEMEQNAHELRRIVDPRIVLLAEVGGRPAGALMAVPDINAGLKACGGRLLPFGFLKFMRALKRVRQVRVLGIAALKEERSKGITALLMIHLLKGLVARGYHTVEASWVLEDNVMSNASIEGLNPVRYKTYRIYERAIGV